ncbi:MAG: hypothetical protein PHT69_00895 [Bacteroidales bacterium]|nr:hypothetical protein [Bacteroidales bacterium]
MFWNFTYFEIFFIILLVSLVLTTLIATINANVINERFQSIYNGLDDKFSTTGGWFLKLLLGAFVFPARFFVNVNHDGWKSGFMAGSMLFSLFIFLGIISLMIFIAFWLLIIVVALWLLGAIFGGSSR